MTRRVVSSLDIIIIIIFLQLQARHKVSRWLSAILWSKAR